MWISTFYCYEDSVFSLPSQTRNATLKQVQKILFVLYLQMLVKLNIILLGFVCIFVRCPERGKKKDSVISEINSLCQTHLHFEKKCKKTKHKTMRQVKFYWKNMRGC